MKTIILTLLLLIQSNSLFSSVKKELTYLVKSSNDNYVDTLVIGTELNADATPNGYFSYSPEETSKLVNQFQTFIKRESDFGFYFQLPEINKLQNLKFFAPALYPRNLKVGETIEDIPLPKIDNAKIKRDRITFSKEEAGNFTELSPEEKAEFIQNLGKSINQENESEFEDEKIVGEVDIIADYKVLDKIYYNNPSVNDFVTVVESTSRSPKGEFKSVYYYHESIGFVYLAFKYEKVKYEVLLYEIKNELIKK